MVQALERLSARTGVAVGGELRIDPRVRTQGVQGRMSPEAALRRMLRHTGLSAQKVGERSFRLVRLIPTVKAAPVSEVEPVQPDIVVTATKRPQRASILGGNIEYVTFRTPLGAGDSSRGPAELAARIPSISSTALGRGRDKLFLRGIADSSFPGMTEATLGEYFGEARINFNAPDPGLLLYDVDRIELLKGPQGTLYGGGTLGGVLRIEPERPNLDRATGFVDATISSTRSGDLGSTAAGVVNLPLVEGVAGTRLLAYRTLDGGYIDDEGRRARNVNRATTEGGRAELRVAAGPWQIDVIGTHQRIDSRDSNYAVAALGPLIRATSIAQPSRNDFDLLDVETRGTLWNNDFVSTTSIGRNNLQATYDATSRVGSPAPFQDVRRIIALNHETRLAHSSPEGAGWVLGISALAQREASEQFAEQPALASFASNSRSRRLNVAAFAQGSLRVGDFLLTSGLRGTYSRLRGSTAVELASGEPAEFRSTDFNVSPMAEVTWVANEHASISLDYRQGFRAEGIAVSRLDRDFPNAPAGFHLYNFEPDLIRVGSLDFSLRTGGARPLDLQATVSAVNWNKIQGSVIDEAGFLSAANLGYANLLNLALSASWKVRPHISLRTGTSITKGLYRTRGPGVVGEVASVPDISTYGSVDWEKRLLTDWGLGVEARFAYRGRSRLGLGFLHDVDQGDTLSTSLAARLTRGRYAVSLSVENLADDQSSLFGYGNPFTVRDEHQTTPQRPRTLSVGFHAGL